MLSRSGSNRTFQTSQYDLSKQQNQNRSLLDGPRAGVSKEKTGYVDFETLFDAESLLRLTIGETVGAVMLETGKEMTHRLTTAYDLITSNAMFFQHYTQDSWRILEYIEAKEKDMELMKLGVYVHPSASVDVGCDIGPNCYIGRNVKVGKGTKIANSVILGGCEIGDFCVILHSIVGFNSTMDKWCRVEGCSSEKKSTVIGVGTILESEVHIFDCLVLPNKHAFVSYYNQTVL